MTRRNQVPIILSKRSNMSTAFETQNFFSLPIVNAFLGLHFPFRLVIEYVFLKEYFGCVVKFSN